MMVMFFQNQLANLGISEALMTLIVAEILKIPVLLITIVGHKFLLMMLDSFQDLKKSYLMFLLVNMTPKFT